LPRFPFSGRCREGGDKSSETDSPENGVSETIGTGRSNPGKEDFSGPCLILKGGFPDRFPARLDGFLFCLTEMVKV
jgi:hypothetical protein